MNRNNKEHQKIYNKEYYKRNRDKIRKYQKEHPPSPEQIKKRNDKYREYNKKYAKKYAEQNKNKILNYQMKYKYNITTEEYNNLLKLQNNVCAICGKPETATNKGKIKLLSVDHNHKTNKARGLLCSDCNTGLGKFKDNSIILLNAIRYIEINK
jgi:hypothetical protein